MRRRLDLPDWGYADARRIEQVEGAEEDAGVVVEPVSANVNATTASSSDDYRVRAQFLAGTHHASSVTSDRTSIRSGKTIGPEGDGDGELDRVELRKAAARLERAADELRAGILVDENGDTRRKAEDELEAFLHQLALIRAELGPEDAEEGESLLSCVHREEVLIAVPFLFRFR